MCLESRSPRSEKFQTGMYIGGLGLISIMSRASNLQWRLMDNIQSSIISNPCESLVTITWCCVCDFNTAGLVERMKAVFSTTLPICSGLSWFFDYYRFCSLFSVRLGLLPVVIATVLPFISVGRFRE